MRYHLLIASVLCVCSYGSFALEEVPAVKPPDYWDHFQILVWQFKTSAAKDKALYESVNLNGFHIDGANAGNAAFARESNWPFYVDHAAGKGFLHLHKEDVEKIAKKSTIVSRPNSLADPATISKMKQLVEKSVNNAKGLHAVAYALDDETSTGSFGSPIETDGSQHSIAAYRKFLEKMYGEISKLNTQYGTNFKSFSDVNPASFETMRPQLVAAKLNKLNFSIWSDWRSYMDTQYSECLAEMVRYSNSLDGSVPCGIVGAGNSCPWGGYDYTKMTKALQWMEAYDINGSNDILASFWDQKRPHMQTFFSSKKPQQDSWFLWYYLCTGNRGVICWPDGWFANETVAEYIRALGPTFKEVQGPVSKHIINGEYANDPIGIYYSQPSIQISWGLDAACHGKTWPNRGSSMDNSISTSGRARVAWMKTFDDLGLQARFVHSDHLLNGGLEKYGIKVLVLTRTLCLSDAEAAAIKDFAAKGGTVIADHLCGICDEHGKAREKGALDEFFGVSHNLTAGFLGGKELTEINGEHGGKLDEKTWMNEGAEVKHGVLVFERGLSASGGKAGEQTAAGAVDVRNGKGIYLNLSPIGYLLKRTEADGQTWTSFVKGILKGAGVDPRVSLQENGKPAAMLRNIFWKNGPRTTLCVVKNIDRRASIDSFGAVDGSLSDSKTKLKLTFAAPIKGLKNERTGKELGDGTQFEDEFTPWEANVYTFGN